MTNYSTIDLNRPFIKSNFICLILIYCSDLSGPRVWAEFAGEAVFWVGGDLNLGVELGRILLIRGYAPHIAFALRKKGVYINELRAFWKRL